MHTVPLIISLMDARVCVYFFSPKRLLLTEHEQNNKCNARGPGQQCYAGGNISASSTFVGKATRSKRQH